jgi:addiction module HigA family antidote
VLEANDADKRLVSRDFTGYVYCVKFDRLKADVGMVPGFRANVPEHPGGFVKSEIVDTLGLSVTEAAAALGVTRPALSKLLNGRAHLSPEMALRIEKAFGFSMDRLMGMQNSFDIAEIRKREGEIKVSPFKNRNQQMQSKPAY